jgi:hypothetical protein
MNPTKNILLTAALAGLVAGATINAQADHHEGDKAKAGKDACKGKDGCKGKNGCEHKNACKGKSAETNAKHAGKKAGDANACKGGSCSGHADAAAGTAAPAAGSSEAPAPKK